MARKEFTILTIGHSTHALDEFLTILQAHQVEVLVDVRRYPGSRRHPHFAGPALEDALRSSGIAYVWQPGLGGRRRRRKDSPHTGWRVEAFAGYADHMESEEFLTAARQLVALGARTRTIIMCAEALPERCHRRLISDWLVAHGVAVRHVLGVKRIETHELTPFARVEGERIVYDGGQSELFQQDR